MIPCKYGLFKRKAFRSRRARAWPADGIMQHTRYFTLEEASLHISWLEAQLQRVASARTELASLHQEVESLLRKARGNGHSSAEQEVAAKRREASAAADRLAQLAQEVHDRGIVLRDPERGLVDFPSLREGREVYLCWLLGEREIGFWHELDAGFAGRQPL